MRMAHLSKNEPASLTDLRAQVTALCGWPQDTFSVAVDALILNKDQELLLLERGHMARDGHGKLEGVGGKVEAENLRSELFREVAEEIGADVRIDNIRFLELKNDVIAESGKRWVIVSYVCELSAGEPRVCEPEKINAILWVDPRKVDPNKLTSSCVQSVRSLNAFLEQENDA